MPSAMYPFEKLPIRTPKNAQIRDVLKGKLATGESLEVHETTLAPGVARTLRTPCALRNVADSRRNGRTDRQRHDLFSRPGSVGSCTPMTNMESRMWVQRRRHTLCSRGPRREFLTEVKTHLGSW